MLCRWLRPRKPNARSDIVSQDIIGCFLEIWFFVSLKWHLGYICGDLMHLIEPLSKMDTLHSN